MIPEEWIREIRKDQFRVNMVPSLVFNRHQMNLFSYRVWVQEVILIVVMVLALDSKVEL